MVSHYILLEQLSVNGANAKAGFTYGFPALTSFLGFTHNLSRHLNPMTGMNLTGCAVFSHSTHVRAYNNGFVNFIQRKSSHSTLKVKNPSTLNKNPSIIEEAKMDMVVSLLIECDTPFPTNETRLDELTQQISEFIHKNRLSGGTIHDLKAIHLFNDADIKQIKPLIAGASVLTDASYLLKQRIDDLKAKNCETNNFEVWTDFFATKKIAVKNTQDGVDWVTKTIEQKKGWIVPLMIGYKAISDVYKPNEVDSLRNNRYPFRMVEAIYGLGEWKRGFTVQDLHGLIWRYQTTENFYLCQQADVNATSDDQTELDEIYQDYDYF